VTATAGGTETSAFALASPKSCPCFRLVKNFSVALAVTLLFFLSLVGLRGSSPPNDGPVAGSLSAASLQGSSVE
jgi:hypothetical protein